MKTKDPFEDLLHRYRGLLFTLCSRFRHRGLESDDLFQEATVALWRARERLFALPSELQQAAMVWRIARNAIIDALRRYHDTEALPEGLEMVAEDRTILHELHEQIALLDEPDRTIVQMQLQGYSYEEIAQALEISEKNVSVRLVRAKEKLRQRLTK